MNISALYESVTNSIIQQLAAGTVPWTRPWTTKGGGIMPRNYATKRNYSGINVCILWDAQIRNDYPASLWLTYKQAQAIGAQVRAGEKSTRVVYTNKMIVGEGDDEKSIGYLKQFFVFDISQMDGIEQQAPAPVLSQVERDDQATRFIKETKADIRHGVDMAFYRSADDFIRLPDTTAFESYEHYLATALHELGSFLRPS